MSTSQLYLRPMPLAKITDCWLDIAQTAWPGSRVRVDIQTSLGRITFDALSNAITTNTDIVKMRGLAAERRYVTCSHFEIKLQGGTEEYVRYQSQNSAQALIEIRGNDFSRSADLSNSLYERLNATDYLDEVSAASVSEARAMMLRERSVADLQTHLDKLGVLLTTIAEREVGARRKVEEHLQNQFATKERDLAALREKTEIELEEKRKRFDTEYEQRRTSLEEKEAAFETRNARYVRRDHAKKLDELLNRLQTEQISKETSDKRNAVRIAIIGMVIVSFGVGITGAVCYFGDPSWVYAGPFSAGVAGLLGTLLFYAKWNDQWFRQHADNEMATRRYKADMLRASWLAELLSEWAETKHAAPTEVVDVFSRNLFTSIVTTPVEHPADLLVGFAKRVQKLDIGRDRITMDAAKSDGK